MSASKSSLLGVALTFALSASTAIAQTYPSKPVRLIVPLPAGSSADAIARIVMPVASKHLGGQIVIENEGGGASIPGSARAPKAAPDGYTLLFGNTSINVVNPLIFNNLPYDPAKDFVAVARTASQALIMAVPAASPAKSVKDFVELAKAGKVTNYASLGPGTSAHLSAETLKSLTGIQLKHIPYQPGPTAVMDLGRGDVNMLFYSYASFLPAVQAGTIRLIGIAAEQRSALVPDIATMREQGYDVVITAWYGVYARTGTSKEIVDKVADAVNKAMADPDVLKALTSAGTDPTPSKSAEDFERFTAEEFEKYKKIIALAGVPKT